MFVGAAGTSRASELRALSFSGDAKYLAALSDEGDLTVFDAESGERAARWEKLGRGDVIAWRPGREELAVARDEGTGWDIWLVGLSGDMRRLTKHPAMDASPQWSPDGTRLIFVTYRGGDGDVYEIEVDRPGARAREVAKGPGDQWAVRSRPGRRRVGLAVGRGRSAGGPRVRGGRCGEDVGLSG